MRILEFSKSDQEHFLNYIVNATPFVLTSRYLNVLFGVATIWLTYLAGTRMLRRGAGLLAALVIAISGFHIMRCQMIEVDVPLTFFSALSLYACLRLLDRPSVQNSIMLGVAVGLAASSKYTGVLLCLPAATALLFANRQAGANASLRQSALVLTASALASFILTSPYVVLDWPSFIHHFSLEREHMASGHFGLVGESSLLFYANALGSRVLGWPALALAILGGIQLCIVKKKRHLAILSAFIIPYFITVSSWEMHADRYLLPLLPFLAIMVSIPFSSFTTKTTSRARLLYSITIVCLFVLGLGMFWLPGIVDNHRTRLGDCRITASEWIEANIPSGSFIVMEQNGPELFTPQVGYQMQPGLRTLFNQATDDRPVFLQLHIPMFQTSPERSEVFYEFVLYDAADYIITSSVVRSRYEAQPQLFESQISFYTALERDFIRVASFESQASGTEIVVYKNPSHDLPFAKRSWVSSPNAISKTRGISTGVEELFYYELGTAYEFSNHLTNAIQSYDLAFRYPIQRGPVFENIARRRTYCTLRTSGLRSAIQYLEATASLAPTKATQEWVHATSERLRSQHK